MSYNNARSFIQEHTDQLALISQNNTIIICPSYESLALIGNECAKLGVFLGAQGCSPHAKGAYTGQVSAQSLKELGCHYVIIGHSECRSYFYETNDIITQKVLRAIEQGIIPIICFGETESQHQNNMRNQAIMEQLEPIAQAIKNACYKGPLLFAYEPIWAIGTGKTPSIEELSTICSWLSEYIQKSFASNTVHLLYGGSVTDVNCQALKEITLLNGLLIGGASGDFQKFKKIVS